MGLSMDDQRFDPEWFAQRLATEGFEPPVAEAKAALLADSVAALPPAEATGPLRAYYVPGRIEVLGKHTDYAGGSSMVSAVQRGFCLVARERTDSQVVVAEAARGETIAFTMSPDLAPPRGHWSNYPMTVARRVARNFPGVSRGASIAFASDLPPAAGMSSSSALMVAVFFALADVNDVWHHPAFPDELNEPLELAGYLGTVENGQSFGALEGDQGVGTFGGSEDHTAILCARAGYVRQYAYAPVRFEREIRLPSGYRFAIASSGVAAEKTGAALEKYNRASRLAARLVELWRCETGRDDPHLAAALATDAEAADRLRRIVRAAAPGDGEGASLLARLEHFLVENEQVIPAAGEALARGELEEFGRWVDRSQQAAEQLLGNQIPETSYLAQAARQCGAVAASAFGAGFGGSVWAMIPDGRIDHFLEAWYDAYRREFPRRAERANFFTSAAGPAMFRLATG